MVQWPELGSSELSRLHPQNSIINQANPVAAGHAASGHLGETHSKSGKWGARNPWQPRQIRRESSLGCSPFPTATNAVPSSPTLRPAQPPTATAEQPQGWHGHIPASSSHDEVFLNPLVDVSPTFVLPHHPRSVTLIFWFFFRKRRNPLSLRPECPIARA
jgi:hypothetical protein